MAGLCRHPSRSLAAECDYSATIAGTCLRVLARCGHELSEIPRAEVRRLLHRIMFSCPATGLGQFLPPSLATAMEEPASTPDAKARNRRAAL